MHVQLRIQEWKDADKPLFPELSPAACIHGTLESVGILERGMESGKPSLWLNVKLPDGRYATAQVSADMFETLAGALRGARDRWGR